MYINPVLLKNDISKVIRIVFNRQDFDKIILVENNNIETTIKGCRNLVNLEKNRMLFDIIAYDFLRKNCFFDIYYNFNDTLDILKDSLIKLINILNES